MKEFGSDFYYQDNFSGNNILVTNNRLFYACGRQPIVDLLNRNHWKRIWMPSYFCHEVIQFIQNHNYIEWLFYDDYPDADDKKMIQTLDFKQGDVLFRVNYFGKRAFRDNSSISVPIIEDHSHDLIGEWASNSNADWCIASLRKTLPIPEGGVLWSPKGHPLYPLLQSLKNEFLATIRWEAMEMKTRYLKGEYFGKQNFLKSFHVTEEMFDSIPVCSIDKRSHRYLSTFDIQAWYSRKKDNWEHLKRLIDQEVLQPESDDCYPFSLILKFQNEDARDRANRKLIKHNLYPAILWTIPMPFVTKEWLLSVHCDARYSISDVDMMASIINKSLQ